MYVKINADLDFFKKRIFKIAKKQIEQVKWNAKKYLINPIKEVLKGGQK